ncbi:MAG: 23S rRNA (uracil(1939)-C(5))-methyltransferase RlmD [Rhodothermales bacterium]|nr:23S rRNA (uracil(1939)-C(5))-methyltransferase RlmD [Rhodothermales bacterium]MBO6778488.1 23S rRNA (uracil(1939)-C(5))-methyltransferase RlmD [Rhodothermales bacterium]
MKKGAQLELSIEKFADRGKSLSRVDGYVVFVPGGVPGDVVRGTLIRKRKSFGEARIDEVLTPSPLRTDPRCRYFGTCGGCKWQHVQYEAQLEAKTQSVREALEHEGGLTGITMRPTLGSEQIYEYRNKMEFSFSAERWLTKEEIASGEPFNLQFALGLHAPGYFNKVIDLEECHLQSGLSARLVNAVRGFAQERGWKPWHIRKHTGYLRHLVIRQAGNTDELLVNLVTNRYDAERMVEFGAWLQEEFPQVTTFVNAVNSGVAQTAFGEEIHAVFGPGVYHDMIGGLTFEIAPNAFFQTNTKQAETLYKVALEAGDLTPEDHLYDLYCGAGSISLFVAPHVKHVIGVELVEDAVVNARANAKANGIENVTFESGDMLKLLTPEFVRKHGKPDVMIVDPPRAGIHPKVVKQIAQVRPERLVYVSCNPRTQARDIALLGDAYRAEWSQPVDLFPHTHHIENVVRLTANG